MDDPVFGEPELAYLREVIESQNLWRGLPGQGPFTERFEDAFAAHFGRQYGLALSSGTAGNEAALAGLGLKPGDEVICPAAAPIFVSMPVVAIGCVPVFADVDPRTMIITPEGIDAAVTPRAKAVVVVHMYGQPAPMDDILAAAATHGLKVVEDCAQAFDSRYKGRRVGGFGDVMCFSLQQSKHITSGEGGGIAADDPEIYKAAVLYATVGMPWYRHDLEPPTTKRVAGLPTRGHFAFGHNYRISELQAAVALAQLEKLDTLNTRRREYVELVESELDDVPEIELAHVYPNTEPNYWCYPLRLPPGCAGYAEINYIQFVYQQMQRERRTLLGIPLPDYVQYVPGLCPDAEAAAKRVRAINVNPALSEAEVRETIQAVKEAATRAG